VYTGVPGWLPAPKQALLSKEYQCQLGFCCYG